jgi:hypothetical protein
VLLARSLLWRGRGDLGFVAVVVVTTFACYPVLRDAWPRVLAASVCFHAAVVALGACAIARAGPCASPLPRRAWLPVASLALAAVIALPPLLLRFAHHDLSNLVAPVCSPGEVPLAFRVSRGSSVTIDGATRPQLAHSKLPPIDPRQLPEGARFITMLNLLDPTPTGYGYDYMVVTNPPDEVAQSGRVVFACGRQLAADRWYHRVYSGHVVK